MPSVSRLIVRFSGKRSTEMQEMKAPFASGLPNKKEYFTGATARELKDRMDARRQELEGQGYTFVKRVPVGRNSPCPCGRSFMPGQCPMTGASQETERGQP